MFHPRKYEVDFDSYVKLNWHFWFLKDIYPMKTMCMLIWHSYEKLHSIAIVLLFLEVGFPVHGEYLSVLFSSAVVDTNQMNIFALTYMYIPVS